MPTCQIVFDVFDNLSNFFQLIQKSHAFENYYRAINKKRINTVYAVIPILLEISFSCSSFVKIGEKLDVAHYVG